MAKVFFSGALEVNLELSEVGLGGVLSTISLQPKSLEGEKTSIGRFGNLTILSSEKKNVGGGWKKSQTSTSSVQQPK